MSTVTFGPPPAAQPAKGCTAAFPNPIHDTARAPKAGTAEVCYRPKRANETFCPGESVNFHADTRTSGTSGTGPSKPFTGCVVPKK